MARKTGGGKSRMDLRREAEAAEAREKDEEKEDDEDEDEDEDEEDEEGELDADADVEADDDAGDDDEDEDAPKKKKKKVVAKKKPAAAKKPARKRAVKEVRMKAIWVVFDNASKRVGVFAYNEKKDAEKLLANKIEEKKTTFYLQLVKEPLEEAAAK